MTDHSSAGFDYAEITTTEALEDFCLRVSEAPWLAIDTEFERERTYWPILCLVQVASAEESAIIDPLAAGIDLAPLFALLGRHDILKVFHAGRQDIEIFNFLMGQIPTPVFDTQIAGMVCGMGESIGYEALVKRRLGLTIDKSWRVTNWKGRPLEQGQKDYAVADVIHLAALYPDLRAELEAQGRLDWIDDEMAILTSPETYQVDPEACWQRVKGRIHGPKQHGALVELAKLRELEVQRLNIPRQRLIKDHSLIELANRLPKDRADIQKLRGVPDGFVKSPLSEKVLKAIALSRDRVYEGWQKGGAARTRPEPALVDLLKLLLKDVAENEGVAGRLIASSADLERLAAGHHEDLPLLAGWRLEIFGAKALDLLAGKLVIRVRDGSIHIED